MSAEAVQGLAQRWREEGRVLRKCGHDGTAELIERHADEMLEAFDEGSDDVVTLHEAADLSGYSYNRLQELVADGTIENVGEKGAPRIRRRDVPKKPGHGRAPDPPRTRTEIVERSLTLHRADG